MGQLRRDETLEEGSQGKAAGADKCVGEPSAQAEDRPSSLPLLARVHFLALDSLQQWRFIINLGEGGRRSCPG